MRRAVRLVPLALCLAVASCSGSSAGPSSSTAQGETTAGAPARLVAQVPTGNAPCGVNPGFGRIWVSNLQDDAVVSIDPTTNRVEGRPIRVDRQPCGVVVADGSVWVGAYAGGTVDRITPDRRRVVARIPSGLQVWDIATGAGSVWASNTLEGTVSRIDPRTNEVADEIPAEGQPGNMRFGFGSLWVGSNSGTAITRIDGRTGKATAIDLGVGTPGSVAIGSKDVWVMHGKAGKVTRVDPATNKVVGDPIDIGANVVFGTVADGVVWLPVSTTGRVALLDEDTGRRIGEVPFQSGPAIANEGFGDVWVTGFAGEKVARLELTR